MNKQRLQVAREAEELERMRRADLEEKLRQDKARAADKANREKIHGAAIAALTAERIGEHTAEKVVRLVAAGSIPGMSIRY